MDLGVSNAEGMDLSSEDQTQQLQQTANQQPQQPQQPNHSQSMMSDAMRPFAADPQAPERPKKKGQKRVGKNVELQPLVEVYYDGLENFYSPVL